MRIAVLGVGPDRRLDRAGRARARRGRRGGRLRPRPRAAASARVELGAIDAAAGSLEEALDGADACFACAPGRRAARAGRAPRSRPPARGLRGHRRRLDQARAASPAIDDERFVGGHPLAGRRDRRRGARPRRPVRGRRLVPDAAAERSGGLLYERLHRFVDGARRAAGGDRRRRPTTGCWPRSATCRTCSPTCSSRRRPRALADEGERAAPGRAELPRRDPRGRRQHRRSGPTSTWPTASAIAEEIDAPSARAASEVARAARAGDATRGRLERRAPRERPPRAARGRPGRRRRCTSCA